MERAPLHLACAGFACALLLDAHSAAAAADAAGLVGQRCATWVALFAVVSLTCHCTALCEMRPSVFWQRSWRKGARAATCTAHTAGAGC